MGTIENQSTGLDCYLDFDQRLSGKVQVSFKTMLNGILQRFAIYGLPFYGRCPDEFVGWIRRAEKATISYLNNQRIKPDRLLSFGEPMSDHLLALRLKSRFNIPWIAHFSDPWVDNPFRKYFFISHWVNKWQERKVVCNADKVIFTSHETLELVMKKYPATWRAKAHVVPHGYDENLYSTTEPNSQSSAIVIRYLGNFYSSRTPEPLFQALQNILAEAPTYLENIRIELIGGVPKRMLKTLAYKHLPPHLVKVVSTVSYCQSLALMSSADLLLVIDAPTNNVSVFLPSKLVDYIGSGVPIFGISPPGTSASLIERLGGYVANPRNVQEIATELRKAISLCVERRRTPDFAKWGTISERNQYRIDTVASKFYEIVEKAIP